MRGRGRRGGRGGADMEWSSILTYAVVALGASIVTSVLAPGVKLAVENRREARAHRRAQVESWRSMVTSHIGSPQRVCDDPRYLSLRSYLPDDVRRQVEGNTRAPHRHRSDCRARCRARADGSLGRDRPTRTGLEPRVDLPHELGSRASRSAVAARQGQTSSDSP